MIESSGLLLVELVLLFFGVAFLVHLLQRRLGRERLRRWMGGRPAVSAFKGIAVGVITPFCTYSAVPLLVGLRQAGVTPAGYVAFIAAAPVLDPILFGALVIIVGVKAAAAYAAVAISAAALLALAAERFDVGRHLKPLPVEASVAVDHDHVGGGDRDSCKTPPFEENRTSALETVSVGPERTWAGLVSEAGEAARAAGRLLRSMGPLLLLGVLIGLGAEAMISPEAAASVAGDNQALGVPIGAAMGTPLYFNTELFVPIADGLAGAGVGVGAIVALTIAGAGANVPEFVILSRLARSRIIVVFIGYVFSMAIGGGYLAQLVT